MFAERCPSLICVFVVPLFDQAVEMFGALLAEKKYDQVVLFTNPGNLTHYLRSVDPDTRHNYYC